MVAVKVTDLREALGIGDDEEWEQIRLDAGEIFVARNCHLQCGKSHRWQTVDATVRAFAVSDVIFSSYSLLMLTSNFCAA